MAIKGHQPTLTQDIAVTLKYIVVDRGFRGVSADKEIVRRRKFKSMSKPQKVWLKRRTAVEPAIGHLKSDHRVDRGWLQATTRVG